MSTFTLENLKEIMQSCADQDSNPVDLSRNFLDVPFKELDFDSLAVLEIATRVQQEIGVRISDDAVAEMTTPQAVLDYVNRESVA
ncbi:acyl carrier protein [Sinosporangium siamense]|uniref:Actinorhodin polyketide synthase n=1 Tax=Sinosporangium siamense TaxID=1367973 RepID=A0A919VA63_9ACTN|nr:acyl carrier protein [Sinosporangium siamense]GII95072.1 actinorhodin polyketide synthase [Sinosporangium siamense]